MKKSDAQAVDLPNGRECSSPKEAQKPTQEEFGPAKVEEPEHLTLETETEDVTTGVVRLLKPTKIPSGYQKMVRAKIEGGVEGGLLLFTPGTLDAELAMPDSMVELNQGKCLTLIMENHGRETLHLRKGVTLGDVTPVTEVAGTERDGSPGAWTEDGSVRMFTTGEDPLADREAKLLFQLELQIEHLTPEQQQQLTEFITSYADVFALDSSELGTTDVVTIQVTTPHLDRRTPFALRNTISEMVSEMLAQGVIKPSQSPWASPVVLVRKKDGGVRFCVDYRGLNRVTKLDKFPLPRIDDTLDLLAGAGYFTTLDLASGYWQVRMDAPSQEKTAFTTYMYSGLYEFQKMLFGLVNAPVMFQRLMEVVLAGVAQKGCLVYLDDVLVIGKSLEEHNANWQQFWIDSGKQG